MSSLNEIQAKCPPHTIQVFSKDDCYTIHTPPIPLLDLLHHVPDCSHIKMTYTQYEQAVPYILHTLRLNLEEYTHTPPSTYTLLRRATPTLFSEFHDTMYVSSAVIGCVCINKKLYPHHFSFSFFDVRECVIHYTSFYDDDILSLLCGLLCEVGCTELVCGDGDVHRLLDGYGVRVNFFESKRRMECDSVLVLGEYLNCRELEYVDVDDAEIRKDSLGGYEGKSSGKVKVKRYVMNRCVKMDVGILPTLHVIGKDGIMERFLKTSTHQGKRLLEKMVRQPLTCFISIEKRLDMVDFIGFCDEMEKYGFRRNLLKFHDLMKYSRKIMKLKVADVVDIHSVLSNIEIFVDILKRGADLYKRDGSYNYKDDPSVDILKRGADTYKRDGSYDNKDDPSVDILKRGADLYKRDGSYNYKDDPSQENVFWDYLYNDFIYPLNNLIETFTSIILEIEKTIDVSTSILKFDLSQSLSDTKEMLINEIKEEHFRVLSLNKKIKIESKDGIYQFKVPRSEYKHFKSHNFVEKSILKSGIVFTTQTLERLNKKLDELNTQIHDESRIILDNLLLFMNNYGVEMEVMNHIVALIDVYHTFSKLKENGFTRPRFHHKNGSSNKHENDVMNDNANIKYNNSDRNNDNVKYNNGDRNNANIKYNNGDRNNDNVKYNNSDRNNANIKYNNGDRNNPNIKYNNGDRNNANIKYNNGDRNNANIKYNNGDRNNDNIKYNNGDVYIANSDRSNDINYKNEDRNVENGNDMLYKIEGAFHPLIKECIKNSITLENSVFCTITGPNMGGKSTFLKTISIISILSQIGCLVPCKSCKIPIIDGLYIRIGCNDNPSKGMSTFMVEMNDIARITRNCTQNSLVIIDELGRGTSAIDGLCLAMSVRDFLVKKKCITMFATHFSELCLEYNQNIVHKRVKCMKDKDLTLLYEIEDGICDASFGIEVAENVGFPKDVIEQAKNIINQK